MSRWQWIWQRMTRRLWLRASLIGLLGVATAILAAVVERFIPWQLPGVIAADAVDSLLNIIATSMLAVTTFSLSVAISAFGSSTSNVTPRSTRLLIEDRLTQNVLSTFVGSFLFAIVGIILLRTAAYGDRGRVVLFAVTVGVIALIVITLLRWIDHLTRLGRVGETTQRVEDATLKAIEARLTRPYLGGSRLADARVLPSATVIPAGTIGYLQHIDMARLSAWAKKAQTTICVPKTPGAFVYGDTVLGWTEGPLTPDDLAMLRKAFTVGTERNFDQDPRFGLAVMSEIALRALSPATNDPGTAIDVIGRTTRLLARWAEGGDPTKADYPRVHVSPLADMDLFEDAFLLVARDGAGLVEVQLRLQKALGALAGMGGGAFRAAAVHHAQLAFRRSETALVFAPDLERVKEELGKTVGRAGD